MKTNRTLAELIEVIPDAALVVDTSGTIVLANALLARMFDYDLAEIQGASLDLLIPPEARNLHHHHMAHFFIDGRNRPMGRGSRILGRRKSGDIFHVEIMLSHVNLDEEEYAIGFVRDTSLFKQTEDKIRRELEHERALALTDHLTGLGNRRAFTRELEQDIAELSEFGWQFAVCFIDLDNFKHINDSHGHDIGDAVLQQIASLIRSGCRGSDFVARIGGDEFATIHPAATLEDAVHVLERVRESIVVGMRASNWPVTLSMGVCHCSDSTQDYSVTRILTAADRAMYEAKQQGKNQIRIAKLDP